MTLPVTLWALSALLSALLTIALGPWALAYLRALKAAQSIREEGPKSHQAKAGTPTMGGAIFLGAALVVFLVLGAVAAPGRLFSSGEGLAACTVTVAFALLGWLDDWLIVRKHSNKGLRPRTKFLGQLAIGAGFAAYLAVSGHGTWVALPVSHARFELGWAYWALTVLVLAATTNAVNLTDGLDALASGVTIPAFLALALLLVRSGGSALWLSPAMWLVVLSGALLGFLWYNGHPAQVFMGDTGSLALGGALGACAVLGHLELFLVPLGAVFVAEALSVMIQVTYFKRTGGKRIFRMSPLHHHFELGGLPETKVVIRFQLVGVLLALAALAWL